MGKKQTKILAVGSVLVVSVIMIAGFDRLLVQIFSLNTLAWVGVKILTYVRYSEDYAPSSIASIFLGFVKRAVVLVVIWLAYRKGDGCDRITGLVRLYVASVVLYILFMLTLPMLSVMTIYYSISEVLILAFLLPKLMPGRVFRSIGLLAYSLLQVTSILWPYWDLYVPYYAFFENASRRVLY
jgi:hypothetical protein